ncbi:MAG: aminoglycoside phosphotransferase family protein [Ilumatobacteraceae bacterium]
MIQPPPLVAQRLAALGERGAAWLADLPALLTGVAERWGLTYGEVFSGGTAAVVVAARRSTDGLDCVVKAFVPEPYDERGFERSVLTHGLAGGRGCVAMLDHDPVRRMMLLERLGPDLGALGRTVPQILEAVSATLLEFWRPVPVDAALPDGVYATQWLAGFITTTWEQLGRPCDRLVIDRAMAYCDERAAAFDPATAVLVHGDAHGWNTLTVPGGAGRGGCKFVDPEGLRSERAHDLGIPMREYNGELIRGDTARLTRQRAEWLGARCDVDPEAVWQWGFIERVSTGLANLRDFDTDDGPTFLEVARRCC